MTQGCRPRGTGAPGSPVFLPIGLILGMLGWTRLGASRFRDAWMWVGVRFGGLLGLIMSQAPYGSVSDIFTYAGLLPSNGRIPILESVVAGWIRLGERRAG